jgi:hypothetical protein
VLNELRTVQVGQSQYIQGGIVYDTDTTAGIPSPSPGFPEAGLLFKGADGRPDLGSAIEAVWPTHSVTANEV